MEEEAQPHHASTQQNKPEGRQTAEPATPDQLLHVVSQVLKLVFIFLNAFPNFMR